MTALVPLLVASLQWSRDVDMGLDGLGRLLIFLGIALVILGGLVLLAGRVPFLGRLPGDLVWERPHFRLYLPLATSLLVSLGLTIALNLILRLFSK